MCCREKWGERERRIILCYGVATISRLLKNIGLFCKRILQQRPIFCQETYIFREPTYHSHPIVCLSHTPSHIHREREREREREKGRKRVRDIHTYHTLSVSPTDTAIQTQAHRHRNRHTNTHRNQPVTKPSGLARLIGIRRFKCQRRRIWGVCVWSVSIPLGVTAAYNAYLPRTHTSLVSQAQATIMMCVRARVFSMCVCMCMLVCVHA